MLGYACTGNTLEDSKLRDVSKAVCERLNCVDFRPGVQDLQRAATNRRETPHGRNRGNETASGRV